MQNSYLPKLTACGRPIDTSPECFGELRSSTELLDEPVALQERMEEDGYLYLPDYLDHSKVLEARRIVTEQMAEQGYLVPERPALEAVAAEGTSPSLEPELAQKNEPLQALLYSGRMMQFYTNFLGGEVRHFDYTWLRTVAPGTGTAPHLDVVFMGRGTPNVYTAWTPLGDISYEMGGLMMLEESHRHDRLRQNYGTKDVDEWCSNRRRDAPGNLGGGGNIARDGSLSRDPVRLREALGGRWLTTEFRAGDLLTFGMFTVHTSLDNLSDRIRLSCDSRYQLASEPADARWVGENPVGHGPEAKRGKIC